MASTARVPADSLVGRALRGAGVLATGLFVSLAWLPFLAGPSHPLPQLASRLANALGGGVGTIEVARRLVFADAWAVCLGFVMAAVAHRMESWYWRRSPDTVGSVATDVALTNALVISLLLFGDFGGRSFIYFAF